jgi:hypothetical protein
MAAAVYLQYTTATSINDVIEDHSTIKEDAPRNQFDKVLGELRLNPGIHHDQPEMEDAEKEVRILRKAAMEETRERFLRMRPQAPRGPRMEFVSYEAVPLFADITRS